MNREKELCETVRKFTNANMGIYRAGLFHDHVQKHGTQSCNDFDRTEIAKGIEIEMEHTDDEAVACKIALDHLVECKDYYTRLDIMEAECGVF